MKAITLFGVLLFGATLGMIATIFFFDLTSTTSRYHWFNANTLPGWLEAIGGLLAIVGVIGVSLFEQRKRDESAKLLGRLAAVAATAVIGAQLRSLHTVASNSHPQAVMLTASSARLFNQDLTGLLAIVQNSLSNPWPTPEELAKMVFLSPEKTKTITSRILSAQMHLEQCVQVGLMPVSDEAGLQIKKIEFKRGVAKCIEHLMEATLLLADIAENPFDDILNVIENGKWVSMTRTEWNRQQLVWWKKPLQTWWWKKLRDRA
jgi:hypothetical protein